MAFSFGNFGEAYVNLKWNDKDFDKGVRDARSKLAGFAKFAGGALAGVSFLQLGKHMTMLASDAAEMDSKLQAVWLKNSDAARMWSDQTAASLGRSRFEVRKFHTELGDLFQPMGFSADEAMKLSKQVTQLAYDLASFNNIADDEALERLRGTLVGSHENALKFGVVINEAALKTELLAMGAKKVNGEFTTQQKVTARLNLLLKGTTAAHGDAARTADGFAGTLKQVSAQLEEVGTELGQELVGPLKEALNLTKQILDKWKTIKHGPGDVGKPSDATKGEEFLDPKNVQSILNLPTAGERITALSDRQQEAFRLREQAKADLQKTMTEKDANINGPFYKYDPVKDWRLSGEEDRLRALVKQLDTEMKSVGRIMKDQMTDANQTDSLKKPVEAITDGLNAIANAAENTEAPLKKLKDLWASDWGGEEESVKRRKQLKEWKAELGDLRTPFEKADDQIKKLDALRDANMITAEQHQRLVAEQLRAMGADDNVFGDIAGEENANMKAELPNMAGRFTADLTSAWKDAQSQLLQKQEDIPEKQLQEQKKQTALLEKNNEIVSRGFSTPAVLA